MAKSSKSKTLAHHGIVGFTSDGIAVLKPKMKPTSFTADEIRATIAKVVKGDAGGYSKNGNIFVERRSDGDFAVRRQGAENASDILPTQKEAIARARQLAPDKAPLVQRVRSGATTGQSRWRRA